MSPSMVSKTSCNIPNNHPKVTGDSGRLWILSPMGSAAIHRSFPKKPWAPEKTPWTLPQKVQVPFVKRYRHLLKKGTDTFHQKVQTSLPQRYLYLYHKDICTFIAKTSIPLAEKYRGFFQKSKGFPRKYREFPEKPWQPIYQIEKTTPLRRM